MNNFLSDAKKALNSDKIVYHVVLGNESCDLDSVISAIVFAYLIYNEIRDKDNEIAIPVLNIPAEDYPLKTEVMYFLKKKNINSSNLIFRDQINLSELNASCKLKLYLTDHHQLPEENASLRSAVAYIVDHRHPDLHPSMVNVQRNIDLVGSCCTLVAAEIYKRMPTILNKEIAELLHAVVVLDTVNLSEEAKRVTPLDIEIERRLRNEFNITYDNKEIFEELVNARKDISKLTSAQLLRKDLKILKNVILPGFPILVREYIKRSDAIEALEKLMEDKKCSVAVLVGLIIENETVIRDMGIYSKTNRLLADRLIDTLKNSTNPNLELVDLCSDIENFTLFAQKYVKASRKAIIPIIENVIKNL